MLEKEGLFNITANKISMPKEDNRSLAEKLKARKAKKEKAATIEASKEKKKRRRRVQTTSPVKKVGRDKAKMEPS